MSSADNQARKGRRRGDGDKSLKDKEIVILCHDLTPDDISSGGGTRTPDTRIMILQARCAKALDGKGLENSTAGRCTYCCIRVEVTAELAEVVVAWPSLTDRQRQAMALMAEASQAANRSAE